MAAIVFSADGHQAVDQPHLLDRVSVAARFKPCAHLCHFQNIRPSGDAAEDRDENDTATMGLECHFAILPQTLHRRFPHLIPLIRSVTFHFRPWHQNTLREHDSRK